MALPPEESVPKPPRFRIDRDGTWFHEDQEVTHAGVLANLWSNLQVDAGGHFLQVGPARIPVAVEDAPFVVRHIHPDGHRLMMLLSDGSREPLDAASLWIGPHDVPYCRVKAARFAARLSRAAAYQLLGHAEPDPRTDRPVLTLGGKRFLIPQEGEPGLPRLEESR